MGDFIEDARNAIVRALNTDDNMHAVIYKKSIILAGFEGVFTVEINKIYDGDHPVVAPDALAAMLHPTHGDLLVYERNTGWHVARRDGYYFYVRDTQAMYPGDRMDVPKATEPVAPEPPQPSEPYTPPPYEHNPAPDDDMPF